MNIQEPVAWVCEGSSSDEKHAIDYKQEDVDAIPIGTMLYTHPQPCPTCESLARTVMMDQTGYDPRPWVGLTDEELIELSESGLYLWELWKAIEAKLKEKNT